jgi:hypothetical protein
MPTGFERSKSDTIKRKKRALGENKTQENKYKCAIPTTASR